MALFDSSLMLRHLQKPVLADGIWAKLSSNPTSGPEGDIHHVLDGGALLHRIPWPRGLELHATVIGRRLGSTILEESRLMFEQVRYLTDSHVALAWIQGESRSYKPFVSC